MVVRMKDVDNISPSMLLATRQNANKLTCDRFRGEAKKRHVLCEWLSNARINMGNGPSRVRRRSTMLMWPPAGSSIGLLLDFRFPYSSCDLLTLPKWDIVAIDPASIYPWK